MIPSPHPMKKFLLAIIAFAILLSSCNLPMPRAQTNTPPPASPPAALTPLAAAALDIDLRAVSIVSPANGETYPFLSSVPVLAAAVSASPITRQELLVNDAVAVTQTGDQIGVSMGWLANQPGVNRLQVRIQTEDGQVILSQVVETTVSPQPVGFDVLQQTTGGETFAGLAGQFGLPAPDVAAYNPGVSAGLNDPLPAGLLIRLPLQPIISADILAQAAPGVDPSILGDGSGSGSLPAAAGIPPFSPPSAPPFDLKSPPVFEKIYYYLSLNGGPWRRVPRLPEDFITPTGGMFNLQEALQGVVAPPAQGTLHAEVDAWGWSGGALMYIGRFERIFNAEPGREPFAIAPGELAICDLASPACQQGLGNFVPEVITNTATTRELRWTPPAGASGGLWQVSRFPFDAVCTPEPGGVFRSGGVSVNGAAQVAFSLDFPAPGADSYSIPLPQPVAGTQAFKSSWFPQTYHVRILPVFNGQVQCIPSNPVTITLDPNKQDVEITTPTPLPAAPVPPVLFDVEIVDFTPIQFPDGQFANCVVVVENPFYNTTADFIDGWLGAPFSKKLRPAPSSVPNPMFIKNRLSSKKPAKP